MGGILVTIVVAVYVIASAAIFFATKEIVELGLRHGLWTGSSPSYSSNWAGMALAVSTYVFWIWILQKADRAYRNSVSNLQASKDKLERRSAELNEQEREAARGFLMYVELMTVKLGRVAVVFAKIVGSLPIFASLCVVTVYLVFSNIGPAADSIFLTGHSPKSWVDVVIFFIGETLNTVTIEIPRTFGFRISQLEPNYGNWAFSALVWSYKIFVALMFLPSILDSVSAFLDLNAFAKRVTPK